MKKALVNSCFLIVFIGLFCFCNCKNNSKTKYPSRQGDSVVSYDNGRFILHPVNDSDETIRRRDTVVQRIEIGYYPNGKIHTWKQYLGHSIPNCIIKYDTSGLLDTFLGNPFIKFGRFSTEHSFIDAIRPVNFNYFIVLQDSTKERKTWLKFDPIITDSSSWVRFNGDQNPSKKGHFYTAFFYFIDSAKKTCRRATIKLAIGGEESYFIITPYKKFPLSELE